MAKYLVYAGCSNEGQILQGQPYDGSLDAVSVVQFARDTLLGSPYSRSDTVWGLEELDWDDADDVSGEPEIRVYFAYDYDADDEPECDDDGCSCTEPPFYWVTVHLAE